MRVYVLLHVHACASWLRILAASASVFVEAGLVREPVDLGSSPETSVSNERDTDVEAGCLPISRERRPISSRRRSIFTRH